MAKGNNLSIKECLTIIIKSDDIVMRITDLKCSLQTYLNRLLLHSHIKAYTLTCKNSSGFKTKALWVILTKGQQENVKYVIQLILLMSKINDKISNSLTSFLSDLLASNLSV